MTAEPAVFQRALVEHPGSVRDLLGYARALGKAGDTDQEARWSRCGVTAGPDQHAPWAVWARAALRQGRLAKVLADLPRLHDGRILAEADLPDLGEIAARVAVLQRVARQRGDEAWRPVGAEADRNAAALDLEILRTFRSRGVSRGLHSVMDHVSDGQEVADTTLLAEPDGEVGRRRMAAVLASHAEHLITLLERRSPQLQLFEDLAVDDGRFRAFPVARHPDKAPITATSSRAAFHAIRLISLIPRRGIALEIGGGFGAVAARLALARPDIAIVLTELPVPMAMAAAYLTSMLGLDRVRVIWPGVRVTAPEAGTVTLAPPWRLPELRGATVRGEQDPKVDLVYDIGALGTMDATNLQYYGRVVEHLSVARQYSLNSNTPGAPGVRHPVQAFPLWRRYEKRQMQSVFGLAEVIATGSS